MNSALADTPFGRVCVDWPLVPLREVAFFQEGPGLRSWQWTSSGMKVINGTNVLPDGSFDVNNTNRFISQAEFQEKYSHFAVEADDIVVVSSGSVGKVSRIRPEHLPLMMNTSVIRFHPSDHAVLNADYLFAFLRSPLFQNQALTYAIGAAQLNFGPIHIKQMRIPLPPIATQRKIAAILSAYDDLIENNIRRIKVMEEMVQRIYREWFVEFRYPGHEGVPLVNSELGTTPVGWAIQRIELLVRRINPGRVYRGSAVRATGTVPVVDQSRDELSGFHEGQPGIDASAADPAIVFGDHTCKVKLMVEPFSVGPNIVVVRPVPPLNCYVLYHLLQGRVTTEEYKRHWSVLASKPAIVPPASLCSLYASNLQPLVALEALLLRQTQTLRAVRDLLLHRLMSGEIDIEDLNIVIPDRAA